MEKKVTCSTLADEKRWCIFFHWVWSLSGLFDSYLINKSQLCLSPVCLQGQCSPQPYSFAVLGISQVGCVIHSLLLCDEPLKIFINEGQELLFVKIFACLATGGRVFGEKHWKSGWGESLMLYLMVCFYFGQERKSVYDSWTTCHHISQPHKRRP